MDRLSKLKLRMYGRHAVLALLIAGVMLSTDGFWLMIGAMIVMASYYLERCQICRHIVWIRTGAEFMTTMAVGPFVLPDACQNCGSEDF